MCHEEEYLPIDCVVQPCNSRHIRRVWVWLAGPILSRRGAGLRPLVKGCKRLRVTDVAFNLNAWLGGATCGDITNYIDIHSAPYQRLEWLCNEFEALGLAFHVNLFLSPNATFISNAGDTLRYLMHDLSFSFRSIHLDAEHWWWRRGGSNPSLVREVERCFFNSWPRHSRPELGIGVTAEAACPANLIPLLNIVDFGIPQMYASAGNYLTTPADMARLAHLHYNRYSQTLRREIHDFDTVIIRQLPIVVGQTGNPDQLPRRGSSEAVNVARMHMMLDTVLSLGDTGDLESQPREISFWSTNQLMDEHGVLNARGEFVRHISQLARRRELRPGYPR